MENRIKFLMTSLTLQRTLLQEKFDYNAGKKIAHNT